MKQQYLTTKHRHFSIAIVVLAAIAPAAIAQTSIPGDLAVSGALRTGGVFVSTNPVGVATENLVAADQGPGNRLLWFAPGSAFRAGMVTGTQWNASNLGGASAAFGRDTMATGYSSAAFGWSTKAQANYSFASGYYSSATGAASMAVNTSTVASGNRSFAAGYWSAATGNTSMASGQYTVASGTASNASGVSTMASGSQSTAMGDHTIANSFGSVVIGRYNVGQGDPLAWNVNESIFEIGNGTPDASYEDDLDGDGEYEYHWVPPVRSNALTVYKNGNVDVQGVITCAPGGNIPMFTGN